MKAGTSSLRRIRSSCWNGGSGRSDRLRSFRQCWGRRCPVFSRDRRALDQARANTDRELLSPLKVPTAKTPITAHPGFDAWRPLVDFEQPCTSAYEDDPWALRLRARRKHPLELAKSSR